MKEATHPDEIARQQTIEDYQILDTDPEEELQLLVELVSRICNVPICLISLVD